MKAAVPKPLVPEVPRPAVWQQPAITYSVAVLMVVGYWVLSARTLQGPWSGLDMGCIIVFDWRGPGVACGSHHFPGSSDQDYLDICGGNH